MHYQHKKGSAGFQFIKTQGKSVSQDQKEKNCQYCDDNCFGQKSPQRNFALQRPLTHYS